MKISLGYEVINSYQRLSYKLWFALAEFVDNSTQSYLNNQPVMDKQFKLENKNLEVLINYKDDYCEIRDNSIGMSYKELETAVKIGIPPVIKDGRSKYGLGMKTAACWLGNHWTIRTKKLGEECEFTINFDVPKVSSGNLNLPEEKKCGLGKELHYTVITITKLHQPLPARTSGKTKNYLQSIYRRDFEKLGKDNIHLDLYWQDELLEWEGYDERLLKNKEGDLVKKTFNFEVDGKKVKGWAGVLNIGSRSAAGFSLIHANRVIKGWPDSYRPTSLFGEQEGGSNDLVNQRLVGEIDMDGYDVTHTKDDILFQNEEQENLDNKLYEECAQLRMDALKHRREDRRGPSDSENKIAFQDFSKELESTEFATAVSNADILPPEDVIVDSNTKLREKVMKRMDPTLKVQLDEVQVWLYVVDDMSSFDPYLVIESTKFKDKVIVIVNKIHPYWNQLKGAEGVLNYLRHCTYDGVAEWRAFKKYRRINPDTVKLIKDALLRVPFEIEKANLLDSSIQTK